jgi:hypothetical protein
LFRKRRALDVLGRLIAMSRSSLMIGAWAVTTNGRL